jgi:hypothetical protein
MKQKLFVVVLAVAVVLTFASIPTIAYTYTIEELPSVGSYTYTNSGEYLGTVIGENDSVAVIEGVLAQLHINVDIVSSSKVDFPNTSSPAGSDFTLFMTYTDGNKSGTWATFSSAVAPPGAALVDFYVVKGAHEFALYQVSPGASWGTWNVANLRTQRGNIPEISHFSGYDPPTTSVPEPTTMLLLGFGLIGLAGIRRKIRK